MRGGFPQEPAARWATGRALGRGLGTVMPISVIDTCKPVSLAVFTGWMCLITLYFSQSDSKLSVALYEMRIDFLFRS